MNSYIRGKTGAKGLIPVADLEDEILVRFYFKEKKEEGKREEIANERVNAFLSYKQGWESDVFFK